MPEARVIISRAGGGKGRVTAIRVHLPNGWRDYSERDDTLDAFLARAREHERRDPSDTQTMPSNAAIVAAALED